MISKGPVISKRHLVLIENDNRLSQLKYKVHEKLFLLNKEFLSTDLLLAIAKEKIVVTIDSYCIFQDATIGYLSELELQDGTMCHWLLREEDLLKNFLSSSENTYRFMLLEQ